MNRAILDRRAKLASELSRAAFFSYLGKKEREEPIPKRKAFPPSVQIRAEERHIKAPQRDICQSTARVFSACLKRPRRTKQAKSWKNLNKRTLSHSSWKNLRSSGSASRPTASEMAM